MNIKEYMDDCLKDFELLKNDYMKNIFFLGLTYSRQSDFDEYQIYLKSHNQIYGINLNVDKIDLEFDECVIGINMDIKEFDTPDQIIENEKQLKNNRYCLLPISDNKINLIRTDEEVTCKFFTIYTPIVNIFSNIFDLNYDTLVTTTKDAFISSICNNFSLDDILKSNITESINLNTDESPTR